MRSVPLITFNIGMVFLIFLSLGCSPQKYESIPEKNTIFGVDENLKYYSTFYTFPSNSSGIEFKTKIKGDFTPLKTIDKIVGVHAKKVMDEREKLSYKGHYNFDYPPNIIYYLAITDERTKPYRKYTLGFNNDFKLERYPEIPDYQREIIEKNVMQLYADVLKTGNFNFLYTIFSNTGNILWIGSNYLEYKRLSPILKNMSDPELTQYALNYNRSNLKK